MKKIYKKPIAETIISDKGIMVETSVDYKGQASSDDGGSAKQSNFTDWDDEDEDFRESEEIAWGKVSF